MSFDLPSREYFRPLPRIRRARGYRLYTAAGERYLDLFQDAGRGILGSRPVGVGLRFKAVLDKLGSTALPSPWETRLARLLERQFPGYPHCTLCSSLDSALMRLEGIGRRPEMSAVWDPWEAGAGREPPLQAGMSLWRPWLPAAEADILVPVVPGAGNWGATCLLSRGPLDIECPPLPAFSLAAQYYSCVLLFRRLTSGTPESWVEFPTGPWRRIGPYLFPRCRKEEYPELVRELLACGVYPSPEYATPSIVPLDYDVGEVRHLRKKEWTWITER